MIVGLTETNVVYDPHHCIGIVTSGFVDEVEAIGS